MSVALMATYPSPNIIVDGCDFDAGMLSRTSALSGVSNSRTGILSCWFQPRQNTASITFLRGAGDQSLSFKRSPGGDGFSFPILILYNSSGTQIGNIFSDTHTPSNVGWYHLLVSWDLTNSYAHFYQNDAESLDSGSLVLTDEDPVYTSSATWEVGQSAASYGDWQQAELYFAPGQYLDFSKVSNRRKFINESGKPVHLGSDGSLPTGTAPAIYQHLDDGETAANYATNAGTGGNFSVDGTLATASTSPSG